MKHNHHFIKQFGWLFICFGMLAGIYSCEKDEVSAPSTLQYISVTNIGPGMYFKADPYYKGLTPTNFSIQRIKFNGEIKEVAGFEINPATGVITIAKGNTLEAGKYTLSVSCVSEGATRTFEDVLAVNMLPATPATFAYRNSVVEFEYGSRDTAYIGEISESVSIEKFLLKQEDGKAYFQIDEATGMVTLNPANKPGEPFPGHHSIVVGISTPSGTAFYDNVLEFNITSAPLELTYTPGVLKIEKGYAGISQAPEIKGSPDELNFSIESRQPETEEIKIDVTTGKIYAETGNSLAIGQEFRITVNASNKYGNRTFKDVFTCQVIDFIAPIAGFSYPQTEMIFHGEATIDKSEGFMGDEVTFGLGELSPALSVLSIHPLTGQISIAKGNTIPKGEYQVAVNATNPKGTVTTMLQLNVIANPYEFSIFKYGNNLGLPEAGNAFQYAKLKSELPLQIAAPATNASTDIVFEKGQTFGFIKTAGIILDQTTGAITVTTEAITVENSIVGGIYIIATTGKGTPEEFSVSVPVFINIIVPQSGVIIRYIPFVAQINSKTGGTTTAPVITGANADKFFIDFRRDFKFFDATTMTEQTTTSKGLLAQLWIRYYAGKPKVETGSKEPASIYMVKNGQFVPCEANEKICYTDGEQTGNNRFRVVVNPDKWVDDSGNLANGMFTAGMTFITDGNIFNINDGKKICPLMIWMNPEF